MRNRYPGICKDCSSKIEKGEGYFERNNGCWLLSCVLCTARRKQTNGKSLTIAQENALEDKITKVKELV